MMEKVLYKLDSFEGPLDLLLTLIKKNKVSIWDIPIAEITDQYLEAIDGIEVSELENTSEFVVMAAQLLYIKSKMLLPKEEKEEEEEDPREELARRLYEYKKFKEASREMRKSEFASEHMVFRHEENIKFPIPEYSRHHDLNELADAFNSIYQRRVRRAKPEKRAFYGIVGREKVSVDDMEEKEEEEEDPREELARRLYEYKKFKEASREMRKSEFASEHMVFRHEENIKFPIPEYSRHHDLNELADAFNSIYQRRVRRAKPEKRAFYGIVGREKVSVDDMAEKVRGVLKHRHRVGFAELFREEDSRPEMIATFLAVLEMIKLSRIRADYDENSHDFIISPVRRVPEAG